MDIKMKVEEITANDISWDCQVEDGIVPVLSAEEEELQDATQAGFLIRGTIPQLPDAGIPWTDFLTGKLTFGELDFYVRESLRKAEKETFYPQYNIENEKMTMTIGKLNTEATASEF